MARILITSGPTREAIDPVRFLSNASSGRMGAALARAALKAGHEVDVVTGPSEVPLPGASRIVRVVSALQMLEACRELYPNCDVLIGAAAVADYRPAATMESKRRRDSDPWILELVPNPDILAELAAKASASPSRTHVGFALQTGVLETALARAREKLTRKHLDWIVLNWADAIASDSGQFWLLQRGGREENLGEISKDDLATRLLERVTATL